METQPWGISIPGGRSPGGLKQQERNEKAFAIMVLDSCILAYIFFVVVV